MRLTTYFCSFTTLRPYWLVWGLIHYSHTSSGSSTDQVMVFQDLLHRVTPLSSSGTNQDLLLDFNPRASTSINVAKELSETAMEVVRQNCSLESRVNTESCLQARKEGRVTGHVSPEHESKVVNLTISAQDCSDNHVNAIYGREGVVHGLGGVSDLSADNITCILQISVPEGLFIVAFFDSVMESCSHYLDVSVTENDEYFLDTPSYKYSCFTPQQPARLTETNKLYYRLRFKSDYLPAFSVKFEAVTENPTRKLKAVFTSAVSGYVTHYGYDGIHGFPLGINATYDLTFPESSLSLIMVSYERFHLYVGMTHEGACSLAAVQIFRLDSNVSLEKDDRENLAFEGCWHMYVPASVFNTAIRIRFQSYKGDYVYTLETGFKMLFSFHTKYEAPILLQDGKFDCSVPYYKSFHQHLECNLETECQSGEDENGNCSYSSQTCINSVAVYGKCYKYFSWDSEIMWLEADRECKQRGGALAMMKTHEEWDAFLQLFQIGKRLHRAHIGLKNYDTTLPPWYKYAFRWVDNTIAFNINFREQSVSHFLYGYRSCGFYDVTERHFISFDNCFEKFEYQSFVCQFWNQVPIAKTAEMAVLFPSISGALFISNATKQPFYQCLDGHVTFMFLSCDPQSFCEVVQQHSVTCTLHDPRVPQNDLVTDMYPCEDRTSKLPYSLVCDFKQDCLDESDEKFCRHKIVCAGFQCHNGQCIPSSKQCDAEKDCWDGSDEALCDYTRTSWTIPTTLSILPPAVINFDDIGRYHHTPLEAFQLCPETHFRCPNGYCLPVYLRCNGVYDCPYHEDELDCQHYTCPGFYRCRASRVCVHSHHICDGGFQCPQRDDELFCGFQCPDSCQCLGLSFVCSRPFNAEEYPEMRYLNAKDSGMTLRELASNFYLVWLSLASCRLSEIHTVELPNLRYLDLSNNMLTSVEMDRLMFFENLVVLRLMQNPITSVLIGGQSRIPEHLTNFDLSHTLIRKLDRNTFVCCQNINFLNISYSALTSISEDAFHFIPNLTHLDIRGNDIRHLPADGFEGLTHLQSVFAESYKFCCKEILRDAFYHAACVAPEDEFSSCSDLLRSNVHRTFLWIVCLLTLAENIACLVLTFSFQKDSTHSSFNVFMKNLNLIDLCMGVYGIVVCVADEVYRGKYLKFDPSWRTNPACQAAGFLSSLSRTVSSLGIFLLVLDHVILIFYPLSHLRFQRNASITACVFAWALGVVLAAILLIVRTPDWNFFRQTALCIPLPFLSGNSIADKYNSMMSISLNSVLFFIIIVLQLVLCKTVWNLSLNTDDKVKGQSSVKIHCLNLIVLSNFVCRFPVGLLELASLLGTPIAVEVKVIVAVFIMPLNSALNPLLSMLSLVIERRRKNQRMRLLRLLESRVVSFKSTLHTAIKM